MTKRVSNSQLTAENWMNEEEPEDAGTFSQAGENKLQRRIIKKAKRRLPEDKNGVPSTPFAKFAGFETKSEPATVSFSFLQNKPTSNGKSHNLSGVEKLPATTPRQPISSNLGKKIPTEKLGPFAAITEHSKTTNDKSEYLEKLKSLNLTFIGWVKEHLDKNAFCDFTPVCTDYIEHVQRLEKLNSTGISVTTNSEETANQQSKESIASKPNLKSTPLSDTSGFSFLAKKELGDKMSESNKTPVSSKQFSFFSQAASSSPLDSTSKPLWEKPVGGFGFLSKDSKSITSGSPPKPFSFSSQVASAKTESASASVKEDDDDNYLPPKNEFEAVKESDALYSKRCKLFFKKDENYVDKGVGTLFLKRTESNKTQLVVRADTSLGNILLNIILNETLPTERVGKNNVLIVCIPHPPVDPKAKPEPTPLLFRVKTSEDADELFDKLMQYKTAS